MGATNPLERAVHQHRQGQLGQAEATYRDVLARQPDHPDALHFLGLLLHQQGDSVTAAGLIERALCACPDYTDALKNLGNIHQECGNAGQAEDCYRRALEIDDQDADTWNNLCVALKNQRRFAEAIAAGRRAADLDPRKAANWFNLGNALAKAGQLTGSADAYKHALGRDRKFVPAHVELCHVLYRLDRAGQAPGALSRELTEAYRNWLQDEPDSPIARFMLAACEGDVPAARAPDDFVRELFDGFAESFDQNLSSLDYRVPVLIEQRIAGNTRLQGRELDVLDAGCGTGLCGPFLRTVASHLTGVDLSGQMLQRAARRGVYDQLIEAELCGFLQSGSARFDLIVGADTLVYFGDLGEISRAAANALTPGGIMLFTLERQSDDSEGGVTLNPSGRYTHSRAHVEECLRAAGLDTINCEDVVLRQESGQPVEGLLVEAQRPGATKNEDSGA